MPAKPKHSAKTSKTRRTKKTATRNRSAARSRTKQKTGTSKRKQKGGNVKTKRSTAAAKSKRDSKRKTAKPAAAKAKSKRAAKKNETPGKAKTRKTSRDLSPEFPETPDTLVGHAHRRGPGDPEMKLENLELVSAVMESLVLGNSVQQIRKDVIKKYGETAAMSRQKIHNIIHFAGANAYLQYHAPAESYIADEIHDRFDYLDDVNVVNTTVSLDVARVAARALLKLVKKFHDANPEKDEVHIGFAAGQSMLQLAQSFARLLWYNQPDLPKHIVFHAMLSGHEPGNPTTDPNAFFTLFLFPQVLAVQPRFMGLRAPAIMKTEDIPPLKRTHDIAEAYREAKKLDIIATSGADWEDKHSSLRTCMQRNPNSYNTLLERGTIGDMLWRPLSAHAPVTVETETRALTLVELTDLPDFLRRGKVLCMLGPCARCNHHKGRLLETILGQSKRLVSHLVIDSRTARYTLRAIREGRI